MRLIYSIWLILQQSQSAETNFCYMDKNAELNGWYNFNDILVVAI